MDIICSTGDGRTKKVFGYIPCNVVEKLKNGFIQGFNSDSPAIAAMHSMTAVLLPKFARTPSTLSINVQESANLLKRTAVMK